VSSVFNLLNILELIVDGFDNGTLAQDEFIEQGEKLVVHVASDLGDQLQTLIPEDAEKWQGKITPITEQLAG